MGHSALAGWMDTLLQLMLLTLTFLQIMQARSDVTCIKNGFGHKHFRIKIKYCRFWCFVVQPLLLFFKIIISRKIHSGILSKYLAV